MPNIYCFQLDTETFEIEEHTADIDDDDWFDGDRYEHAAYNEDGFDGLYVESLISAEKARDLAYAKSEELAKKFLSCMETIRLHTINNRKV